MKKIGILFGGCSAEHEVSVKSAHAVYKNIDRTLFEPVLIFISKGGGWQFVDENIFENPRTSGEHSFIPWRNQLTKIKTLDLLFPVLHGPNGEDGKIQGLFELAGVPYAGPNSFASGLAMNKYVSKILFQKAGLLTPDFLHFDTHDPEYIINRSERILSYPTFVKPCSMGSSVGISKVNSRADYDKALFLAFKYDSDIIIEKGIDSLEIEVSVLGNDDLIVSEPGQVIPHNEFYDYEDKYLLGKTEFLIPASLPQNQIDEIKQLAKEAFKSHFLNGCSRIDFLIERGTDKIFLNEINTIPGFTEISMFPKLMNYSGIGFTELISRLISLGFESFKRSQIEVEVGPSLK